MSYIFETQYNSPNYTEGNNGRQMIILHWWDDPAEQPSYSGTISTLCNPNRGASAHFVATGTGRRVACLVNLEDTAWHAGTRIPNENPNPYSIGIECDPRCRDEDYDVVAELIANIRSAYGDLPLKGHNQIPDSLSPTGTIQTTCPGNWDLARLDALARTKDGSGDWGVVTNIYKPTIVTKTENTTTVIPFNKKVVNDATKTGDTITTVGVNGKRVITYNVTYTDGKETKRMIATDITTPAIDQVTTHGTYVPPITPPVGPIVILPVETIWQRFWKWLISVITRGE